MDKVRQGNCTIGRMLFAQSVEIINPATSRGMTPNLVLEDPSTSFIFKGTDISSAPLQAELRFLSTPMNHKQTAEMGNQSLNSLALISARYTHTSNDVLTQLMASQLIAVCQALDLRVMHIQFLENFRPEFEAVYHAFSSKFPGEVIGNITNQPALLEALWKQMVNSLETTVTLNAKDRFTAIAQACRATLLNSAFMYDSKTPVRSTEEFCGNLANAMLETWVAHREAYLIHGDATTYLGQGSACMYTFIRKTLGIPILCSARIRTPSTESGVGDIQQAPTVGSFISVAYRALRDGKIILPLQNILQMRMISRMHECIK